MRFYGSVYDSPYALKQQVEEELLQQEEDKNLFEHVRGASEQLLLGVIKGFSTLQVGDDPDSTFEELAYSVGNLIGFIGGIGPFGRFTKIGARGASLVSAMTRGTYSGMKAYAGHRNIQLARQVGAQDYLKAQAQFNQGISNFKKTLKGNTPDWFSEPTMQFNSVPFYVADLLKSGAKAGLARVPRRAAGAENTASWLYDLNKVLPVGSKSRDTLEQAVRIGTAFGVAEWQDGPKAMVESFAMGAVFGGFDKVIANYTPLKPKIGSHQRITDLRNLASKNEELRTEAKKQLARGVAGGLFNMASSVGLGGKPELLWYDFALGFYFSGIEISAGQRRAMGFIHKAERDNSWRHYEKLPEWTGEGTDEYGNPTPMFSDEVKFELLRHQEQKMQQMSNMTAMHQLAKAGITWENYYDYINQDTLDPQFARILIDQGVISQSDVNRFRRSKKAFGPEIMNAWLKPKIDRSLPMRDLKVSGLSKTNIQKIFALLKDVDPNVRLERDDDGNIVEISTNANVEGLGLEEASKIGSLFERLDVFDLMKRPTQSTEVDESLYEKDFEDWQQERDPREIRSPEDLTQQDVDLKNEVDLFRQEIEPYQEKILDLDREFEINDIATGSFKTVFSNALRSIEGSDAQLYKRFTNAYQTLYNHIGQARLRYRDEKLKVYKEFDQNEVVYPKEIPKLRMERRNEAFGEFLKSVESDLGVKLPTKEKQELRYKFIDAVFASPIEKIYFNVAEDLIVNNNKRRIKNHAKRRSRNKQTENFSIKGLFLPNTHENVESGTIVFGNETNIKNYSGEQTSENGLSDLIADLRYDIRGDRDPGRFGDAGYALFDGDLIFANSEIVKFDRHGQIIVDENMQYEKRDLAVAFEDVENIEQYLGQRSSELYKKNLILLYGVADKDQAVVVENPWKSIDDAYTYLSQQLGNADQYNLNKQDQEFLYNIRQRQLPKWKVAETALQIKYRLAAEGYENFHQYMLDATNKDYNFIRTPLNLNKRRQIETQRGQSLQDMEDLSALSMQGQKERALRVVLVEDDFRDPDTKEVEDVMTDGAAIISRDLMKSMVKWKGMNVGRDGDELPSSIKPFAWQRGDANDLGQFMMKAAFHQGSKAQEKLMKELGADVIVFRSAAKASGKRTFYSLDETATTSRILDANRNVVSNPDVYSLKLSSITINRGNYDNAEKNIDKDTRIPLQVYQNILNTDRDAAVALYKQAFETEGSEWLGFDIENQKANAIYQMYLVDPDQAVLSDEFFHASKNHFIDVNKLGMREMLSVLYHMNGRPTHLYDRIVKRILNETREDLQDNVSLSEEDLLLEALTEPFQESLKTLGEQKGADLHFRVASGSMITPADRLSKHGFNYFDKVLKTYVSKRLFRPKLKGTMKSIMLPNTESIGIVRKGAFKLARGGRKRSMVWGEEGEIETTLGKAWDLFQEAGGWKRAPDWMKQRMRMATMRSPAPTISATRVLEFDGFLDDITGTGVQFHNIDMRYQGGADLDIDSAFVFTNFPRELKDAIDQKKYKYQWHEDYDITKDFISEKSMVEKFTEQNVYSRSGGFEQFISGTSQWKFNVSAKSGKNLLEKSLGFGKKINKWYPELELKTESDPVYGNETNEALDLRFEEDKWFSNKQLGYNDDDPKQRFLKFIRPPSGNLNENSGSPMKENTTMDKIQLMNQFVGTRESNINFETNQFNVIEFIEKYLIDKNLEFEGKPIENIWQAPKFWGDIYWTANIRTGRMQQIEQLIRQATNFAADSANYEKLKSFEHFRGLLFREMFDIDSMKFYVKHKGKEAVEIEDISQYFGSDNEFLHAFVSESAWDTTSPAMRAIEEAVKLLDKDETFFELEKRSVNLRFHPDPKDFDNNRVEIGYWKQVKDELPLHYAMQYIHDRLDNVRPNPDVSTYYDDIVSLFHWQLENMVLLNNEYLRDQTLTQRVHVFNKRVTDEMHGALQYSESYNEILEANKEYGAIDKFGKNVTEGIRINEWGVWKGFHPKHWLDQKNMLDLLVGTEREKRGLTLKDLPKTTELQHDVLRAVGRKRLNIGTEIPNDVEINPNKRFSSEQQLALELLKQSRALHRPPSPLAQQLRTRQEQINRNWGPLSNLYADYQKERLFSELNAQDLADEASIFFLYPRFKALEREVESNETFFDAFKRISHLDEPGFDKTLDKFVVELSAEASAMRQLANDLRFPKDGYGSNLFDLIDATSIELEGSGTKVQSVMAKAFSNYLKDKTERVYGFKNVNENVKKLSLVKELRRFIGESFLPGKDFLSIYLNHSEGHRVFQRKRQEAIRYRLALKMSSADRKRAFTDGTLDQMAKEFIDKQDENTRPTEENGYPIDNLDGREAMRAYFQDHPDTITQGFRDAVNDYISAYYLTSLYPQAQTLDQYVRKNRERVRDLEDILDSVEYSAAERGSQEVEETRQLLAQARNQLRDRISDWYKTYHSSEPTSLAVLRPELLHEWQQTYRAMYRSIGDPLNEYQIRAILDGAKIGNILNVRSTELMQEPPNGVKYNLGLDGEEEALQEKLELSQKYDSIKVAEFIDNIEKISDRIQIHKVEEELEWLYSQVDKDPEVTAVLDEIQSLIKEIQNKGSMLGIKLSDMSSDNIMQISAFFRALDVSPALRPLLTEFESYFLKRSRRSLVLKEQQEIRKALKKGKRSFKSLDNVFEDRRPSYLLDRDEIIKLARNVDNLSQEALDDAKARHEAYKLEIQKQIKSNPWKRFAKKGGKPDNIARRDSGIPVFLRGKLNSAEKERQDKIKKFKKRLTKASQKRKDLFEDALRQSPEDLERMQWLAGFFDRHPQNAVMFRQKFLGVLNRKLQHAIEPVSEYKYVRKEEMNAVIDHFRKMEEASDMLPEVRHRDFIMFPEMVAENLLPLSKFYNQRKVPVRGSQGVSIKTVWEPLSHFDLLREGNNAMVRSVSHANALQARGARIADNYIKEHVSKKGLQRKYKVHAHKVMLSDHYKKILRELDQEIKVYPNAKHLIDSRNTLQKLKDNLDQNIQDEQGTFKKSWIDGIIERERRFLKQNLRMNANYTDLVMDTYFYENKTRKVVNIDKTRQKLHRFVVNNQYLPDWGVNVIKQLRDEIILENTVVDLRKNEWIVGKLNKKQQSKPKVLLKSLKKEKYYFKLRLHVRKNLLKQTKEFNRIDAESYFPIHGYTEAQKLAAFEEIVRRHNKQQLESAEYSQPESPWVKDLIRYVGYEGGSNARAGSKMMSGKLKPNQYKTAQMETIQGLIDPSEGKHLLYLTPHIVGIDTGPHVIANWADSIARAKQKTLFSIYSDWLIKDFEKKLLGGFKTLPKKDRKLYRQRLEAWKSYFRMYARQVTGRSAYIPQDVRNNASFQIGKILLNFSDTKLLDRILLQDQDTFLKEYDIEEKIAKKQQQHLVNTERGLRIIRSMATRRAWVDLEAKYQLSSILAHPKVWIGNVFGGGANILIQQGVKPFARSFDYKWLEKNVDASIRDEQSMFEFAQNYGVENSELSQEVDYLGRDQEGEFVNARRYTVIDNLERIKDNKLSKAAVKQGARFIQSSEKRLRAHAFMTSYVHNMEIMGINEANHMKMRPVLVHLANRSVEATQFLYDNGNRPFIAATPLGKAFFRFKLWVTRSIWKSWKMHEVSAMYGYRPSTPGYDQMKRFMIAMMFMQFMSELFPYSLFETASHPLIDQGSQLASLLFGSDYEQSRTFFGWGEFGILGAMYGFASPTYLRLPSAALQSTLHNVKTGALDKISKSDSPFEEQIVKALEVHGYNVVQQIEVDGYLIDIGILDKRTNQVILVIEADGAKYHSSEAELASDKERQRHLETYGYDFHRILSTDWINDPHAEMQKMLARIRYEAQRLELDPYYHHKSETVRIMNLFYKSIMEGDYRKLVSYHLPNAVPFGRLGRSAILPITRSDSIGDYLIEFWESGSGVPIHATHRELKKWLQEANQYTDQQGSALYD